MKETTAEVVLLGGGHANVLALLLLADKLPRGLRPLLISESETSPYSGMLPGYIAGHYRREECFINLAALARRCGAGFLRARATKINADDKTITLADGGSLHYDLLSVNVGSARYAPVASPQVCTIKPIDPFMKWLSATRAPTLIVGAGAAGVELALSMPPRDMVLAGRRFLPGYPQLMCDEIGKLLKKRGVKVYQGEVEVDENGAAQITGGGDIVVLPQAGRVIFATAAAPPKWLSDGGAKTTNGWLHINKYLQSTSHENIFAAGDCAHCDSWRVQKSGVVAVRQAPVLAKNILAKLRGDALSMWQVPRAFLAIIGGGNNKAFAGYGNHHWHGITAWHFKRFLDKRFMRRAGVVGGYS